MAFKQSPSLNKTPYIPTYYLTFVAMSLDDHFFTFWFVQLGYYRVFPVLIFALLRLPLALLLLLFLQSVPL